MIGKCRKCGLLFDSTTEDACDPNYACPTCYKAVKQHVANVSGDAGIPAALLAGNTDANVGYRVGREMAPMRPEEGWSNKTLSDQVNRQEKKSC